MKTKVKYFLTVLVLSGLVACTSSKTSVAGYNITTYVDFSIIRDSGFEVTVSDVPNGYVSMGIITEIVTFGREYSSSYESTKSTFSPTITKYEVKGNFHHDQILLAKRISQIIEERGGKGIANLKISTNSVINSAHRIQPEFSISGTIFK